MRLRHLRYAVAGAMTLLTGCTADLPRENAQSRDVQKMCAARMYAARQPHSAVNWSVYDYCMKT
ncbi:MAG TPA: hypothetical protein VLN59_06140, partial [Burkholderiales bacterium]|nr:hypothetical protein [Burkholderiales bacterium]